MKLALRDDMRALERRIDEHFKGFFGGGPKPFWPQIREGRFPDTFLPSSDVFKRGDDLVMRVELPGIDPEKDLSVELADGYLVVRGTRRGSEEVKEDDYFRKEVWEGSYERHLPVPEGTTEEAVSADYGKGVLEVVVRDGGKTIEEPPKPPARTIPVKTHG